MELLQFTDFVLDDRRFNWYFDKYQLRAQIKLPGIQHFRNTKSTEDFENRLDYSLAPNYHTGSKDARTTVRTKVRDVENALRKFITWKHTNSNTDFICKVSFNTVDIYTNDLYMIQDLKILLDNEQKIDFNFYRAEKIPNFERSVVYHKNPKHMFRLFLASRVWTYDERQTLLEFLNQNSRSVFPCSSLIEWITRVYRGINLNNTRWSSSSFFIDFDDEQFITYFGLKFNGSVGKLCHIKKR